MDALLSALNEAERERNTLTQEIRNGVKDIARVFMAESGSPPEQHIRLRMQAFESVAESPEWLPAFEDWFNELHEQHRDTLRNDAHFHAEEFKNKFQMLKRIDERIAEENRLLQRSLSKNIATDVVEDIQIKIESGIKELEFLPALERISELHEDWTRSGEDLPPNVFTEALSDLLEHWSGNDGIAISKQRREQTRKSASLDLLGSLGLHLGCFRSAYTLLLYRRIWQQKNLAPGFQSEGGSAETQSHGLKLTTCSAFFDRTPLER